MTFNEFFDKIKIAFKIDEFNKRNAYSCDTVEQKITVPKHAKTDSFNFIYAVEHEKIHLEIAKKAYLNKSHREMRKIYSVFIDCFLEQFSIEMRRILSWRMLFLKKLNLISTLYIFSNTGKIIRRMSENKDLVKFCEYVLKYNKKCELLWECTQLIHEGTATWCALKYDYSDLSLKDRIDDFKDYIRDKEKEILSQESIYKKGYMIINENIVSNTENIGELISIASLALSPPENTFGILMAEPDIMQRYIQENWKCEELWIKLLNVNFLANEDKDSIYQKIYTDFYGSSCKDLENDFQWLWKDESAIKAIRLLKKDWNGNDIHLIIQSENYVSPKPMPYTETKKIILGSSSVYEYMNSTICYHRKHINSWGSAWEPDNGVEYTKEYDENQRIHFENITNMMSDIVAHAKEKC